MSEYDPALFASAATSYARARRYPPAVYDRLRDLFSPDGTGRLLDVATGTGQLAVPLAPYFHEVIALDPDVDMLGEAQGATMIAGARNIAFVRARAEDLPLGLGIFHLVTIGSALHWMDRARVLETIYDMLEPGGGLAVVNAAFSEVSYEGADPRPVWGAILQRYLAERPPPFAPDATWERHEVVIARTRFGEPQRMLVPATAEQTVDDIVALLFSTSFANRARLGPDAETFERQVREGLNALEPSGLFRQSSECEILYAHKL